MMWIVRAGIDSPFYGKFIKTRKIYLAWEGEYDLDLSDLEDRDDFKAVVAAETRSNCKSAIAGWASQLVAFSSGMKIGDYVLIPAKFSRTFCLAKISGNYEYDESDYDGLYHSRDIEIITTDIPRAIFPQSIVRSLGAFRTVFKAKPEHEEEILNLVESWKTEKEKTE